MTVEIRPTTVAELEALPYIYDFLDEYAAESAVKGLPHPSAKAESYKNLEATGIFHIFGAFTSGELIGYITVLVSVLMHFDQMVATTESFFVRKAHRKTGAGLKLLRTAEKFAREQNSPGLLISAPLYGDLCELLPLVGYAPTSCIFFKNFRTPAPRVKTMSAEAIDKVSRVEAMALQHPQIACETKQTLHAGLYTRTVKIPAGVMITGALIRVPTTLVVDGDVTMYVGDEPIHLIGHNVLVAEAGRKQAFYARSDVYLTMMFATEADSVDEAEEEFTDEVEMLQTRQLSLFSSGEQKCLASQPQQS